MGSYNEKSDILITLIGTSPMPNLISLTTRLKKGGCAYLIFSKETEYICEKLEKKCNTNDITVKLEKINDVYNPKLVYENISDIFIKISKEDIKDKVIELNFIGGTKVMSSISYAQFIKYFRKKAKSVLTTYLDGEKSQMIIRDINKNKDYINKFNSKDGIFSISIEDIGELHTRPEKNFDSKNFEDANICSVNYYFYESLFRNLDNKENVVNLLNKLQELKINKKLKKSTIEEVKEVYDNAIKKIYTTSDEIANFENVYQNYQGGKFSTIADDLTGTWFEYGLFRYLNQLKKQGYIDDVVNSLKRKDKSDKSELEIDLIVLKNYEVYVISVTTDATEELSKHKLYEVKLRAEQFAGTEVNIGFICFAENRALLESKIKDIWDKENKKYFLCTWNELNTLEKDLKIWICSGGDEDE